MTVAAKPYPMTFEPVLLEKVWGGRRLASLGKDLPDGVRVGESWEITDMDATSASGAGGGAARSVIADGVVAGRTLRDAIGLLGDDLVGPGSVERFPLLIKYLDAREHLSVQVHPSPAFAAAHPDAHLKTEAWHIVEADAGSVLYLGLRQGVTHEDLRAALTSRASIEPLLRAVPATPGHTHVLPSGLVHALGAGVLVAEVQTPSDTTFRVYDWTAEYNRPERELHVDESLACMDVPAPPPPGMLAAGATRAVVGQTEYFTIEGVRGPLAGAPLAPEDGRCRVVMVTRGRATLATPGSAHAYSAGTTVLVPACLAGSSTIDLDDDDAALVVAPEGLD